MDSCQVNKGAVKPKRLFYLPKSHYLKSLYEKAHCRDTGPRKRDPFPHAFKWSSMEMLADRVAWRHKFFMDDYQAIQKANKHYFDRRHAHLSFFSIGEFGVCHSWL
ncbi:hypothetical protein AVEN_211467-1 [Araneus ventricosus]|uniref:Uncharacterized protein n=1 Tax=Araneus ventricosus TaxID=182803 RepID=A0A4Y2PC16_ARAVE|nr:hypothetical protein AVEN_211467-1 [Araneus ventricosus]